MRTTKTLLAVRLALAGSIALLTHAAIAQTWQTVDNYQYAAGQSAGNAALAVAPNGTLLAAGWAYDSATNGHAVVVASADNGVTWSAPLDDYTGPVLEDNPSYYAVGLDPAGNLYGAGLYADINDPNITDHWFVRRSTDSGATWSTVDDVAPFSGSWFNQANAIAADAAGNVYVAGYLNTGSGSGAWIVRKSASSGNFTTVDSFPCSGGIIGAAAIYVHPTAGIFVAGQADLVVKGVTIRAWIVRRSTNAGATWSTVDTFYGTKGATYYFGRAYGINADAHGNLYVVGALAIPYKSGAPWQWVVRRSANGGSSWSTVDTYQLAPAGNSVAAGLAFDSHGNIYVAGYGNTTYWGVNNWIVRSSPTGTNSWSTVDTFQYVNGDYSSAAAIVANATGNVFVGGRGSDATSGHWLVRKK
jgi:hypothetical protein